MKHTAQQAINNEILEMAEHKALIQAAQKKADDINKALPDVRAIVRNDATICFITGSKYKVDTIQALKVKKFDYSTVLFIILVGAIVCAVIFGHA